MDGQSDFQLHDFHLTEHQWLTFSDAYDLIAHLVTIGRVCTREGDLAGERKMRLFGVACCRHLQHWSGALSVIAAVDAAERFADGEIDAEDLDGPRQTIEEIGYPQNGNRADPLFNSRPLRLARAASLIPRFDDGWVYYTHIREVLYELGVRDPESAEESKDAEVIANLFRDIFGNPFRPVTFNPKWRTSDVLLLAQGIYDERAFERMPILADALQDAECDNDDILNHCRGANTPHVRGCWVVDLVLGKE